jgi:hypothetical protein
MSLPGGPSKPKMPPPAGSKKGLGPGTRPGRNQTLREQQGQKVWPKTPVSGVV